MQADLKGKAVLSRAIKTMPSLVLAWHTHTHAHTHARTHAHTHMHAHIRTHTHTHTHTCTHTRTYAPILFCLVYYKVMRPAQRREKAYVRTYTMDASSTYYVLWAVRSPLLPNQCLCTARHPDVLDSLCQALGSLLVRPLVMHLVHASHTI